MKVKQNLSLQHNKRLFWVLSPLFVSFFIFVAACTSKLTTTATNTSPAGRVPSASEEFFPWSYDGGPDLNTPMGRELLEINSRIPHFPSLSTSIMGTQKFRPVFGPMPWRMVLKPNSIKILFIGQDGTHIAEAAGRPATAGFGGRAQDLAKYFGVSSTAAFINAYTFTIKGQYGTFSAPIFKKNTSGSYDVRFGSYVDNGLWMMSQDLNSPLVQWRNDLIDWIIRNNQESLKLVVLFGGAARDSAASFVISRGGQVGPKINPADLANIKVPELMTVSTGGNGEAAVPVGKNGKDFYPVILGRKPNYMIPEGSQGPSVDMKEAQDQLMANPGKWMDQIKFSNGGISQSGVMNAAQLGGYAIDRKMSINGKTTLSLRGLRLKDGSSVKNEVLVVQLPHPTALSMMKDQQASEAVANGLRDIQPYVAAGWRIDADPGYTNNFAAGQPYRYARADMGPEYYDFGAPASRMVNVSTAVRAGKDAIIFGTRDKAAFRNDSRLFALAKTPPNSYPDKADMWSTRPIRSSARLIWDAGPEERFAKLMKSNLSESLLKEHDTNRDFGHYRGTFDRPKVVIFADPDGYDDLLTSRALTGTRGQYLQGLMNNMGVGDKYLVIKTAPFSKESNWDSVVSQTNKYREDLFREVATLNPVLYITDGSTAKSEFTRILSQTGVPVVHIERTETQNGAGNSGIEAAASSIRSITEFAQTPAGIKMANIPRSHLPYYARIWEGTSGDRVIASNVPAYKGKAFAIVAPAWAYNQKYQAPQDESQAISRLLSTMQQAGIPLKNGNLATESDDGFDGLNEGIVE